MILNRMAGGWRELPDNIFCDIMTMVGLKLKGLKDLHYSRLVCHDWNAKISQMTKQRKSIIKEFAELQKEFAEYYDSEIYIRSSLAHHGLLGSVENMILKNVDLASVPAQYLASLTSCTTNRVSIVNVSNTNLSTILANVKSKSLHIRQSLDTEETQALVQLMENTVNFVELGDDLEAEVSMDLEALIQYSGQGACDHVLYYKHNQITSMYQYLRNWAQGNNWEEDSNHEWSWSVSWRRNDCDHFQPRQHKRRRGL